MTYSSREITVVSSTMSLKRVRGASRGSPKWDSLPWKSIEPTLERDDGWQRTGGDDQAFVYSLEEIPGGEYALHCDSSGVTKIVAARDRDEPFAEGAGPHAEGARGKGSVTSLEGSIDGQAKDHGHDKKVKGVGKKRAQKGKASPGDGEGGERYEPATRTASAATGDFSSVETSIAPVDIGKEGVGGESGKEGEMEVGRASEGVSLETRHRRKRRRGQGKKKNMEAKAGAAGADGLTRGSGGGNEVEETSPCSAVSRVGDSGDSSGNVAGTDAASDGVLKDLQRKQHAGQATAEEEAAGPQTGVGAANDSNRVQRKLKKKRKRKRKTKEGNEMKTKKAREADTSEGDGAADDDSEGRRDHWELSADAAAKMLPWLYLGVELHPALMWHLHRQGFYDPTPIQKRVLPKAILGRKDVIGAAETGSGKTLAFGLPILNDILTRRDAAAAEAADATRVASESANRQEKEKGLQALVLCPTRELALQVAAHFREVVRDTGLAVVAVVGGLAEVKQERQLSRRPEVVVATPGRFWELAGTHAYLSHLETLRHLVVDEADRMLERGHYPELKRLFATLGTPEEEGEVLRAKGDGFGHVRTFKQGEQTRKRGESIFGVGDGGGIRSGRHRLRRWGMRPGLDNEGEPGSLWSEDGADEIDAMEDDGEEDNSDDDVSSGNITKVPATTAVSSATSSVSSPVRNFSRQTYVFSATLLTCGATGRRQQKRNRKAGHRGASDNNEDGKGVADPVTKIMRRLGVRGDPAVIDMGRRGVEQREGEEDKAGCRNDAISVMTGSESDVGTPALPSTLQLCSIKSLQMEKDVHVYLFCATYPGRTLVFVNAIACARRLAALLCILEVKATPLHAQMQQRQRLKSLERFTSEPTAVLVATDVAARGLDIPKVEHVVHYDAARSAEVFVHRAGRTARARAAGLSLSIVAPRDDAHHRQTCSVLGLHDGMQAFPVEIRLVDRARERVGMALKVMKFQHEQSKVSASNDFFRVLSKDADLIIDGDLLVEGGIDDGNSDIRRQGRITGMGRKGNRHAERLAAEARRALEVSLSRPLHVDRRKLIPVAQALVEARKVSQRTAAGDLLENQNMTRSSQRRKVSS